ncbi:hypothetical protein [Paenibacillus sp. MDMC362]|uniref:hypothetical protein n=1 Tax=Paenibacillus sp. MDMC362 TaxID=2977365 RepID=UPI000DC2A5EA|nr:hypothetical protein [Paenibacillus sp. MDMC362]RAR39678.1 hypothetical protein DP091_29785 [Paenibacillus sp. MDMC362]
MKSEWSKDLKRAIHNKHHIVVFLKDNKNILGIPEESIDPTRIKIRTENIGVTWVPITEVKHLSVVVEFSTVWESNRGGKCVHCGLELYAETQSEDYLEYCDYCVKLLGLDDNT